MARIIQKFGGTSVADIARLETVSLKVKQEVDAKNQVAVVVSAMAGVTNQLVGYARALAGNQIQTPEYDVIAAAGEQVTSGLLALALKAIGIPARSFLAWQIPIFTDAAHADARIQRINPSLLEECWRNNITPVIAGFQGLTPEGRLTTLGRGGSDTTAVALAVALQADRCDIYTDVAGVYTADPRIVPKAQRLKAISYEEMEELAAQGAKVLHARSVETARAYQVPIRVLSSFHEEAGTDILPEECLADSLHVSGITHKCDEAKVTLTRVQKDAQVLADIFEILDHAGVTLDMIVQNVSLDDQTDLTFSIPRGEIPRVMDALANKQGESFQDLVIDPNVAKITVVGVGLQRRLGIATLLFKTLAQMGITTQVISCSSLKISVLISESAAEEALCQLHTAYGLDKEVPL